MKNFFLFAVAIAFLFVAPAQSYDFTLNNAPTQVYFSPRGGCTAAVINQIDTAQSEVLVQAYSFTSASIAKALLQAQKRGVRVKIVLDKSQKTARYSAATFFKNSQIPVFIDYKHPIAHNKIMIVDRQTVITGSFNFSKAAEEENAENLLIIGSKELAGLYVKNWFEHKNHSEELTEGGR